MRTEVRSKVRRVVGLVVASVLSVVTVSCTTDFSSPTEAFRDIDGTYSATFVFTNRNDDGSISAVDCDGTLIISEQDGFDLVGTIVKDGPCVGGSASFTGRVGFAGELTFELTEPNPQAGFSGDCVLTQQGPYYGGFIEGEITLSRPYAFTCNNNPNGSGAEVIGATPQ